MVPPLPIAKISVSSLITINPSTPTIYRYHQGVFSIICKNWSGIKPVNLLPPGQGQKEHINLANNQVSHNTKIKSRERKQAIKTTD
jgi:hypothetical protein